MAEIINFTIGIKVSQPRLEVVGTTAGYPTQEAMIVFGHWFKGDKGDPGEGGIAEYGTTSHWNEMVGYIPKAGQIIVYSDYETSVINGEVVYYPGIKIGSGNAYVQDLQFVGRQEAMSLYTHLNDNERHITQAERVRWNNKLNITDAEEVSGEILIFNRN